MDEEVVNMPRPKYKRSSKLRSKFSTINMTKQEPQEIDRGNSKQDLVSLWLLNFERDVSTTMLNFKNRSEMCIEQIDQVALDEFSVINPLRTKKTLLEMRQEKLFSTSSFKSVTFETASLLKNLNCTTNTTFTVPKSKSKKPVDDEGYLTAGETGSQSSTRSSSATRTTRREKQRSGCVTRASRSLSRSKLPGKNVTIQAPEKKTPENRIYHNKFGTVTPKMRPNMPVSVLRRPKQGEMAISMQGSPLLVSGVVTESCANVNIPLTDGRILSLQPSHSLRLSEIPHLDNDTRQQLATLRDNLNKVVRLAYDD